MHATATEAAMPNTCSTGVHPASEPAVYSTHHATAMHAATEARLPAEGVLGYHTAMVKAVECAGVATWRHVRRDESAVGAMIKWFTAIALGTTTKAIVMISKTPVVTKSVMAVYKSGAP